MADERVVIEIELDDGSVKKGFANIKREGETAGKKVGKGVEQGVSTGIEKGGKQGFSFLRSGFVQLAAVLGGVSLFRGAIQSAIQTEQLTTQLKILTGSAQAATKVFKELEEFAAATPFETEDIVNASNKLLAFGFEAGEVRDRIREIGEVAAGSNQSLNDIALIYGQVAAAGKLTGERLLQLQERSIPIGPAIKKALGGATESIKDLVASGRVTLPVFQKAFRALSEEGGLFAGALAQQSQTVGGILSTLSSNVTVAQTAFGELFSGVIVQGAQGLITQLQSLATAIRGNSETIKSTLLFSFNLLKEAIGFVTTGISTFSDEILGLTAVFISFKAAIAIQGALAGIGKSISGLRVKFTTLRTSLAATKARFDALPTSALKTQFALVKLGAGFKSLNIGLKLARIGVVTFQAALTFGLSLLLTEVLAFVLETKEELGGWGNLLKKIGLESKLVFLQVTEAVVNATNNIITKLSLLNNLPFGLGDKFSAFSTKLVETNITISKSISDTRGEIDALAVSVTNAAKSGEDAAALNTKSNLAAQSALATRLQAEKDLLALRKEVGGFENQLLLNEETKNTRILELDRLRTQGLLQNETEYQALRNEILTQATQKETALRDQAILQQEASFNNFSDNFIAAMRAQGRASRVTFGEIAATAQNVLARGVGTAFQNVGKAIASGQSAFGAFKDALKNILAEIASATGDLFIKQGIGYLFFNPALGAGLIAAGAGLKVLSGVLGASGGSPTASAGTSGGAASLDLAQDPTLAQADVEREEPQVVFQTTIQGDVLDSSDTQKRLINLFQQGAEEEGIELNNGVFAT